MKRLHDSRLFQALLRNDLAAFVEKCFQVVAPGTPFLPNWHIEVIADRLTQCMDGSIKRLIITVPPRSLKSICASIAFPAWVLGHDPTRRIICTSYGAELASSLARDCRSVMLTEWYHQLFPHTRLRRAAELDLATTRHGMRYATSVGGTLTGLGGSLLILDDPMKPQEAMSKTKRDAVLQWYTNTLYSRLDSKAKDVIIVVMQRLHVDDLIAHLLVQEPWVHLDLPAIAVRDEVWTLRTGRRIVRKEGEPLHATRESLQVLEAIRATIGSATFSAQYQQQPVPEEGNMVKWHWFARYDIAPAMASGDRIVQSWDMANKSTELADYSVCTTWQVKGQQYYLLDVFRAKLEFPSLRRAVITQARQYGVHIILMEDSALGTPLIQDFRDRSQAGVPPPLAVTPKGEKVMRLTAQSSIIEAGQVWLPRTAPWLEDFQAEVLAFPASRHDDQVDSVSQFLTWIGERGRYQARWGTLIGNF